MIGVAKLLLGHGNGTPIERVSIFMFFSGALGACLIWALEREDSGRELREGALPIWKKVFLGGGFLLIGIGALFWWITHPGAPDQWVWLLGAILAGGGGFFFIFWKPKKR